MRVLPSFRTTAIVFVTITTAALAHGQGSCNDPWINQAYNQLYGHAPSGSGTSGDCNTKLYGNGQWSSYADLTNKVIAVRGRPTRLQPPSAASTTPQLSSTAVNPALRTSAPAPSSILQSPSMAAARQAQLTQYHVDMEGNLVAPAGILLARSGQFLISASIVAQGGGNIVAQGGGNVLPSPGMLINAASSNFIVRR